MIRMISYQLARGCLSFAERRLDESDGARIDSIFVQAAPPALNAAGEQQLDEQGRDYSRANVVILAPITHVIYRWTIPRERMSMLG